MNVLAGTQASEFYAARSCTFVSACLQSVL
jgi:hypothetical protein